MDTKDEVVAIISMFGGPQLTCPNGTPHDYSIWKWESSSGTAVCSKCGHRAIDDPHWQEVAK